MRNWYSYFMTNVLLLFQVFIVFQEVCKINRFTHVSFATKLFQTRILLQTTIRFMKAKQHVLFAAKCSGQNPISMCTLKTRTKTWLMKEGLCWIPTNLTYFRCPWLWRILYPKYIKITWRKRNPMSTLYKSYQSCRKHEATFWSSSLPENLQMWSLSKIL